MRLLTPAIVLALVLSVAGCSKSESEAPRKSDLPGRPGVDTREDNKSTFALDVDTASYTFASRQLDDGRWPDRNAIRPEEFVNAFKQHYPEPRGDGFAVHADGARLPSEHEDSSRLRLLRIGLQTKSEQSETRPDATLTFVIDISGSMAEPGRLDLVQDALHYLIDQLRPNDSVAIVTFNENAKLVREMTRVADKARLHTAIDTLRSDGSTNLGAGLVKGYEHARDSFRRGTSNRVILLSDGLANTGTTNADTLVRRIADEAAKEISLLGVGVGSEYGDKLMEQLADKGDGFVVYISERRQARDLFVKRLPGALAVRAYDAKAQVVFDKSIVESYSLVGYENRELADSDFRDDTVDGGEVGPGHSVTALYVVKLRDNARGRVAQVKVRWLDPKTREPIEEYETVEASQLDQSFADSHAWLRVSYAAAYFAEALRSNRPGVLPRLAAIAEDAGDELEDKSVTDLAIMIRSADRLR